MSVLPKIKSKSFLSKLELTSDKFNFDVFEAWVHQSQLINFRPSKHKQKSELQNIYQQIKYSATFCPQISTYKNGAKRSRPRFTDLRLDQQFFVNELIEDERDDPEGISNYIVDLGDIIRQHEQWVALLPNVQPFYAVKCNPDPVVLQLLHCLGCGFDCASKQEFELLSNLGILDFSLDSKNSNSVSDSSPKNVVFSNPCKYPAHLQYARQNNIQLMTFDNEYELQKISDIYGHDKCKLLLRIKADDSHSICQFNSKFGCESDQTEMLFQMCKDLNLSLNGVMFHVGSGCMEPSVYKSAIEQCKQLFSLAATKQYQFPEFNVLDLGGGFTGFGSESNFNLFPQIADSIRQSIGGAFGNDIQIIAEPGRYYVSNSHILVTDICSKSKNNTKFMYYINEGMYTSFNCIWFDHAIPDIIPYSNNNHNQYQSDQQMQVYESAIFGPTCDSMDCVVGDYLLPEMSIGDKLIVPNFGAYTNAAGGGFNGFCAGRSHYVISM